MGQDAIPTLDVVIVGGGHGGAQVAITLRQSGFAGTIAIVTDECEFPYERPPLSKEYFSGEKSAERLRIRPPAFWEEKGIALILNKRVVAVDPDRHNVTTRDGLELGYRKLVWAAGGSPRRLSQAKGRDANVLTIRTLGDANRLKDEATQASRVTVIGGGYIGLEAAAVLAKSGKQVTLVEALDRVLARAAGVELSRYVESVHRSHGVDIRLGAKIHEFEGQAKVNAVRLADGSRVDCDFVVAGIGIDPEVEPLKAAGARCGNGVEVDEYCRSSLPDVFAIGDCAAHRNTYAGCATVRLESVQNAVDMAKVVADCIAGSCQGYHNVPWFWSNQYDIRIQTVGLSMGHDQTVIRGDMDGGAFSIVYLRRERVIALDCVNSVRDFAQGKALVVAGAQIPVERLADTSMPLKDMFAR
ncbi:MULTISPECIES: NAD(P)/FAD-dependent oxidoreductase [Sphingobium]|uniref:NAD(P)/FAD-dependent oxidoreductase n=1 Tax=Sphingobium TaxID=165695 RepID=UPI00159C069A|nr:FAD-dependent oxidoreductase [Sphingobium sp. 15-1]